MSPYQSQYREVPLIGGFSCWVLRVRVCGGVGADMGNQPPSTCCDRVNSGSEVSSVGFAPGRPAWTLEFLWIFSFSVIVGRMRFSATVALTLVTPAPSGFCLLGIPHMFWSAKAHFLLLLYRYVLIPVNFLKIFVIYILKEFGQSGLFLWLLS